MHPLTRSVAHSAFSLAALCVLSLQTAPRALACPPLAVVWTPTSYQIPAGGDVVLVCVGCDVLGQAQVVDNATGQDVAGEVIRDGITDTGQFWAVFRPTQPLVAGQTLTTSLGGPPTQQLEVVESQPFDVHSVGVLASLEAVHMQVGASGCCVHSFDGTACEGRVYCVSERENVYPILDLHLADLSAGASQYLYRASFSPAGSEPGASEPFPWTAFARRHFEAPPSVSSYCYTLSAESLKDGSVVEVAEGCVENQLGPLGERTVPDSEIDAVLSACPESPEGYEERWCSVHAERCVDVKSEECSKQRRICGRPEWTSEPQPDPLAESAPTPNGMDGHCSAAPWTTNRPGWLVSALGLFLIAGRARRFGRLVGRT